MAQAEFAKRIEGACHVLELFAGSVLRGSLAARDPTQWIATERRTAQGRERSPTSWSDAEPALRVWLARTVPVVQASPDDASGHAAARPGPNVLFDESARAIELVARAMIGDPASAADFGSTIGRVRRDCEPALSDASWSTAANVFSELHLSIRSRPNEALTLPSLDTPLETLATATHGKYVDFTLIGSGAMGRVYRAIQVTTQRPVAIKTRIDPGGRAARYFRQEIIAGARSNHPNVAQVYDAFEHEASGELYLVMEYLEGQSMASLFEGGTRLDLESAIDYLRQAARGLAALHRSAIIHRDLKPENLVLSRGEPGALVKIVDLGIATVDDRDAEGRMTAMGAVAGTPVYMSPEQWRGDRLDPRTDVFSLGLVGIELLSGQRPPQPRSQLASAEWASSQLRGWRLRPMRPRWLRRVLRKATAPNREHRFADGGDLLTALER